MCHKWTSVASFDQLVGGGKQPLWNGGTNLYGPEIDGSGYLGLRGEDAKTVGRRSVVGERRKAQIFED